MKANGSRRAAGGGKKYHGKNQVRPPAGCREKNSRASRRWAGVGGGGGRCGAGRARAGSGTRFTLGARHHSAHSALGRVVPLAPTPVAPRALVTCPLRLCMSKVPKSVLPIAAARVPPQPISEPQPTRTPLRVSTPRVSTAPVSTAAPRDR
ncbi:unnamed protein product, partial [Iphiclides podalirius]